MTAKQKNRKPKPNSSIIVNFYRVHEDFINRQPPQNSIVEPFIDLRNGEVFGRIVPTDLPHCVAFEVKPQDEIAEEEFSNVTFEVFNHATEPNIHESILWPAAKAAKEELDADRQLPYVSYEFAFLMQGGFDNSYDGREYWSEYEFIGMVKQKILRTVSLEYFFKSSKNKERVTRRQPSSRKKATLRLNTILSITRPTC